MYSLNHRKDIDGLRAIAILLVLFFHIDSQLIPAGFIGVDIFFVISGFLITKIIIKEIEKNDFSFISFYIRRIRRIFPALFTVLVFCLVASFFILSPRDFEWFGKTLKYASLQASNIFFQKETGYFDPQTENMMLLHTWSLGVEEQFYIIWPVILFLLFKINKFKNASFYSLITISVISLILSQVLINIGYQKVSFFNLSTRLWELALGGILAFDRIKIGKNNIIRELASLLGIAMIIISLFVIKKENFPGVYAILPCVGTALIILSYSREDKRTLVTKILSNNILVFIGLISYSLYLWHWPIILIYKMFWVGTEGIKLKDIILLSSVSVAISYLSWKYIENPFRVKKELNKEILFKLRIKKIWKLKSAEINFYKPITFALLMIICLIPLSKSIEDKGWKWRVEEKDNFVRGIDVACQENTIVEECIVGDKNKQPSIFLFGDSHAGHYSIAIGDFAKTHNLTVFELHKGGCPPLIETDVTKSKDCMLYLKRFEENRDIIDKTKYVFLAARWSLYLGDDSRYWLHDTKTNTKTISQEDSRKIFEKKLEKTISLIGDKKIIILGEVPQFDDRAVKLKSLPIYRWFNINTENAKKKFSFPREKHEDLVNYQNNVFQKIIDKHPNVEFFNPTDYFCNKQYCFYEKDSQVLYSDDNHLNNYGSRYIGQYFLFNKQ